MTITVTEMESKSFLSSLYLLYSIQAIYCPWVLLITHKIKPIEIYNLLADNENKEVISKSWTGIDLCDVKIELKQFDRCIRILSTFVSGNLAV